MNTKSSTLPYLCALVPVLLLGCSRERGAHAPSDLDAFASEYAAAWGSQDPARVAGFFSDDGSLQINDGEPFVGREEIGGAAQGFMTAFPDMVVTMDSLVRSGDRASFHWTLSGTNTEPGGTDRAVLISGFEKWTFGGDGLIAVSRGHYDEVEFQRQLASGGPLPQWDFDPSMVFPADRSLARPEDGIVLADGSLIVGDQVHGLRRVEPDGRSEPFGKMVEAGYVHRPPAHGGGANGISLEPNGTHVLVTDIFGGGIYRVALETGTTERVYQHGYGVNTAVRDSRGAVWFTQSAQNTAADGEARMWAAVDVPVPEGALLRLGMDGDRLAGEAELLVDSLYFANGLALDEARGHLYLAETVAGRLLRFGVDLDAGTVGERTVFVDGLSADNLELDGEGNLWAAVPLTNEVVVIDLATGRRHSAFRSVTPAQLEVIEEMVRRGAEGLPRLELFTPAAWDPLPGPITGVILSGSDGPVYIANLGDALVKLDR